MSNKPIRTPVKPSGNGRPVTKEGSKQPIRKSSDGRKITADAKSTKGKLLND